MSKYLVSAGVVWVFLSFVIGIMLLLVPVQKNAGVGSVNIITTRSKADPQPNLTATSNVAKTSVQVEGTADGAENAAQATVKVLEK